MRIVSQNKTIDVNYDDCVIRTDDCLDHAWNATKETEYISTDIIAFINGSRFILATYPTKERALEVMEMIATSWMKEKSIEDISIESKLLFSYIEYNCVFVMPNE